MKGKKDSINWYDSFEYNGSLLINPTQDSLNCLATEHAKADAFTSNSSPVS